MSILKAYMPGCKGRSFTLQSPKTGSPGRSGCDSRWDLSHRVHQSAWKAVFILATCKKEILKADITRRVCSHISSRNKEARQFMFLLKKLSTYGQMFLRHSSLQVRKHWRKQDGVCEALWRGGGEILFLICQFLIEITVNWNTFFGTWLYTKGLWQLQVRMLNFKELHIVLKVTCPLTKREIVSSSDNAEG